MEVDHRLSHLALADTFGWPTEQQGGVSSPCHTSWKAVEVLDEPKCSERAAAMRAGLSRVELELSESPLTLERLADWHSVAVPNVGMRTDGWAFAKGGKEKYSLDNSLLDQRLRALTQEAPLTRCLKAYLDILFFHPFKDGNSRAARLAFHYFACLDGLEFRLLDPLFRLSIPAGNEKAYSLFCKLSENCLKASRQAEPDST